MFAFTNTKDQWASKPCRNDRIGIPSTYDGQTIGALQKWQHLSDGGDQIAIEMKCDQLRDHFSVSIASKMNTLGNELSFEGGIVFNDAVVDDGHLTVVSTSQMGMCVGISRRSMRGPTSVTDANATWRGSL